MWTDFFVNLWLNLFGSVDGPLGLDWGFWVSMLVVCLFVVVQNVYFWSRKPLSDEEVEERRRSLE